MIKVKRLVQCALPVGYKDGDDKVLVLNETTSKAVRLASITRKATQEIELSTKREVLQLKTLVDRFLSEVEDVG